MLLGWAALRLHPWRLGIGRPRLSLDARAFADRGLASVVPQRPVAGRAEVEVSPFILVGVAIGLAEIALRCRAAFRLRYDGVRFAAQILLLLVTLVLLTHVSPQAATGAAAFRARPAQA